ncbi:MAG TPA: hypothetical protein VFP93_04655 [Gammaproteobacteria bacterium]|nr:hypothetical protein [Gammaproteobacteria bacterium]
MGLKGIHFDGDELLDQIITEIYAYLHGTGKYRFDRWFGSRLHHIQWVSWAEVTHELYHFIKDPPLQYSNFIHCLETQKKRFPPSNGYSRKLEELAHFLAKGPSFSEEYQRNFKPIPMIKRKKFNKKF